MSIKSVMPSNHLILCRPLLLLLRVRQLLEIVDNSCECAFYMQTHHSRVSPSVVSDSLWPHELQQARLPCPLWTPRACSNSCPSSRWCHPMPSNHLILCHPLLLLPSIFPSIRVFSNESVLCIRWPKYSSFIFSISPSIEYSGLISFIFIYLFFF